LDIVRSGISMKKAAASIPDDDVIHKDKYPRLKRVRIKKILALESCREACQRKQGCLYWSFRSYGTRKFCLNYKISWIGKKNQWSGLASHQSPDSADSPPSTPPSSGRCRCGLAKRTNRIVGGEETEVNEYPWQVGLMFSRHDGVSCGGSLISDQWVLTAAHCTVYMDSDPTSIKVVLGDHDIETTSESTRLLSDLSEIVNHPEYDDDTTDFDFALLKLQHPIDFSANSHIRPVCLPTNDNKNYNDYEAITTGWGTIKYGGETAEKLQEVAVKVISNDDCQSLYSRYEITDQMICAGDLDHGGKDACQGDSGGPLITAEAGHNGVTPGQNYEIIGLVSWGLNCAKKEFPGVYARTSKVLQWISETTRGTFNTCPRV